MKSIKKLLMLSVLAVMTAFCLAPGLAFADKEANIGQNDFNSDGKYEINQAGTYNLTEDVTGSIYVGTIGGTLNINLNGHTLKNENGANSALYTYDRSPTTININGAASDSEKLGCIVQDVDKNGAIRLDSTGATTFNLSNLEVKAKTTECLQAQNGKLVTLTNVNMSASGKANSLIYVNTEAKIESGVYKASDAMDTIFEIDKSSNKALTINGGSFNMFPQGTTLNSDTTLYKEANDGYYKVVSTDDERLSDHCWKVTLNDTDQILYTGTTKDIYFKLESEAKAFAGDKYAVEEIGNTIDLSTAKVSLKSDSYTYDGTAKKPQVDSVVLDDKTLTEGLDYTVSYKSNVNAGTGYVVISGVNDYEGTVEQAFTINQADFEAAKVTLSKTAFTYNGKAQKPSVKSVVLNGKTLKSGTDYTASIASGKKVGTYKVTITAKGSSYKGYTTASFVVNPKGVSKFKVSKAKKAFKAKWTKNKTERSGVQIRYSTNKSMKNAKTVKAKGASVKAKTVKKLKKKTKYYVQARSYKVVNGKTYYSSWSAKKAVKTK